MSPLQKVALGLVVWMILGIVVAIWVGKVGKGN